MLLHTTPAPFRYFQLRSDGTFRGFKGKPARYSGALELDVSNSTPPRACVSELCSTHTHARAHARALALDAFGVRPLCSVVSAQYGHMRHLAVGPCKTSELQPCFGAFESYIWVDEWPYLPASTHGVPAGVRCGVVWYGIGGGLCSSSEAPVNFFDIMNSTVTIDDSQVKKNKWGFSIKYATLRALCASPCAMVQHTSCLAVCAHVCSLPACVCRSNVVGRAGVGVGVWCHI